MRTLVLLVIPIAGVALAIGLFVFARAKNVSTEDWAQKNDSVLAQLLSLNPGTEIVMDGPRLPFYWVKHPQSGFKVLIPKSEAENAKFTITDCAASSIPQDYLYPNRIETACVEIRNDRHTLNALYFRTRDEMRRVIDFYNLLIEPGHRISIGQHTPAWKQDERRKPGTKELICSWTLYENYYCYALVGYKETGYKEIDEKEHP